MKAVLVGAGGWGRNLAKASQKVGVEIVATVDPAGATIEGIPSTERMQDLSADAAFIATPNHTHLELVREAVASGLHVHVEKPMAATMNEAREMAEICRAANRILFVGHNTRRHSGHRWLKRELRAGTFGAIVSAEAWFSHASGLASGWRMDRALCPAVGLTQLGVHFADTLQYLLGPVSEVKALFAHVAIEEDNDDSTHALLRFASGPIGFLSSNYSTPYVFGLRVHGTKGVVEVDEGRVVRILGQETFELPPVDTVAEQVAEFARCVAEGSTPETGADAGLAALAVIEAAVRDAATPGTVLS